MNMYDVLDAQLDRLYVLLQDGYIDEKQYADMVGTMFAQCVDRLSDPIAEDDTLSTVEGASNQGCCG